MRSAINIFGIDIPMFGILVVCATVLAWTMIVTIAKKTNKFNTSDATYSFLIGMCGGVIGACTIRPSMKLIEVILFWEHYQTVSVGELADYMMGEFVFFGGLLGGMIAVFLFCKKFKIRILPLFDLAAPALALGHSIGRIGCFFGGCCYGIEVSHENIFSIIYPPDSLIAPSGVPLLAIPLIEAVFLLVLAIILTVVYFNTNRNGICATIYLLTYSVGRFIIEFFRGDAIRGNYGLLTTSQYISIAIFIFGIVYFISAILLRPVQAVHN